MIEEDLIIIDVKLGVLGVGKILIIMIYFFELYDNLYIYKVN